MSFFKYKSVENDDKTEYVLDIIKNNRMYLSSRKDLNDPLEGICDISFGFAGSNYYAGTPFLHPHYEEVVSKIRVLSLTKKMNSIVMWSHYGSMFNGICIELDDSKTLYNARKVVYSDKIVEAEKFSSMQEIAEEAFLHKAKEWTYEEEYRIISKNEFIKLLPGEIKCVHIGYAVPEDKVDLLRKECISQGVETRFVFVNPYEYKAESKTFDEYTDLMRRIGKC